MLTVRAMVMEVSQAGRHVDSDGHGDGGVGRYST